VGQAQRRHLAAFGSEQEEAREGAVQAVIGDGDDIAGADAAAVARKGIAGAFKQARMRGSGVGQRSERGAGGGKGRTAKCCTTKDGAAGVGRSLTRRLGDHKKYVWMLRMQIA